MFLDTELASYQKFSNDRGRPENLTLAELKFLKHLSK